MNKEEALKKIEELKAYVESCDSEWEIYNGKWVKAADYQIEEYQNDMRKYSSIFTDGIFGHLKYDYYIAKSPSSYDVLWRKKR